MKPHLLFFMPFLLLFLSCGKLSEKPLTDQDKLNQMEALLPQAQLHLAYNAGGDHSLYANLVMQQIAGVQGKTLRVEKYNISPDDTDASWISWYSQVLSLLRTIKSTADEIGQKKYSAISRVLLAHSAVMLTDAYGDIPFSKSMLSDEISFYPPYDSQEKVYEQSLILLGEAEELLKQSGSFYFPAADDVFFAGDANRWLEMIRFLRIRWQLNLAQRFGYQELALLLEDAPQWSRGEALRVSFEDYVFVTNPVYVYNVVNSGGIRASATILNLMQGDDPRLVRYFRQNSNNVYLGSLAGSGNLQASRLTDFVSGVDATVTLASYTEIQFVKAEVYFRNGQNLLASQALREAMLSSMADFNLNQVAWVDQFLQQEPLSLQTIMNQKYIALFLQAQPWNDWRRTGFPILEPSLGNVTQDRIPRRFPYPANEYAYNGENVPADLELWDAVWWDVSGK